MKYTIETTNKFKKDLKLCQSRGYDLKKIHDVIQVLANGEKLSEKYRDHALTGNWTGYRECHILPDWLLIYKYSNDDLILFLTRTGTHSDLY